MVLCSIVDVRSRVDMSFIWSVLGFIVMMGIIVTVHEWGHYQVARWFNVKVLKFSIGFGKPVYRKKGRETEFLISQIPLGGYVKFADEREAPVATEDVHRAFNRQSVYKRFAIVIAGPFINLVLAWLAFSAMFMIGVTGFKPVIDSVPPNSPLEQALERTQFSKLNSGSNWVVSHVNGEEVKSWQTVNQQLLQNVARNDVDVSITFTELGGESVTADAVSLDGIDINKPKQNWLTILGLNPVKPKIPAILGRILPLGAAEQAGLQSGDEIVEIAQHKINNWQDFVRVVRSNPGEKVSVWYLRQGVEYSSEVTLESVELDNGERVGKMGVGVQIDEDVIRAYQTTVQYGFFQASERAYQRSLDLIEMSLVMLKRMLIGDVSTDNLSGPISIAQFSGQALQNGLISFLSLLGLLSLSIGILNLLPIPVLDGGHLLFYTVEIVKGSPVSDQIMTAGQFVGLVIILGLTFLAVFNDVFRIFHG